MTVREATPVLKEPGARVGPISDPIENPLTGVTFPKGTSFSFIKASRGREVWAYVTPSGTSGSFVSPPGTIKDGGSVIQEIIPPPLPTEVTPAPNGDGMSPRSRQCRMKKRSKDARRKANKRARKSRRKNR